MKKFIFLFCVLTHASLFAQPLVPYRVDKSWGYADASGKIVIPAKYQKADFFSKDGFARVSREGLYTLLDKNGKEVLPFSYSRIYDFESGLAAVCKGGKFNYIQGEVVDGKWGFINEKFEEVIPCIYARVEDFKGDYAIVQEKDNWGSWGVINKAGKVILPFKYPSYSFDMRPLPGLSWDKKPGILRKDISNRGERWQLIDLKGRPVGVPYNAMHGDRELYTNTEAKIPPAPKGQIEILDVAGKPIIMPAKNFSFTYLSGTNFRVRLSDNGDTPTYQYGILSGNKTTIVPFGKYDYIDYPCTEGVISAIRENGRGFIDCQTGKEVIPLKYGYVGNFENGLAYVAYNYLSGKNKADGMINREGVEFFRDTPAVHLVYFNGDYFLMDEHNYRIEPPWFKGAQIKKIDGKQITFLDSMNNPGTATLLTDSIYIYESWADYCCQLDNPAVPAYTGVDTSEKRIRRGLTMSGLGYDSAYFDFGNDTIVFVKKAGKKGVINLQGKEMVPPIYYQIVPFSSKDGVSFSVSNEDGLTGIVNSAGQVILPMEYGINFEIPGYQIISKGEYDRVGLMKDGTKLIIPVEYSQIEPLIERDTLQNITGMYFSVWNDDLSKLVDANGKVIFDDKTVWLEAMEDLMSKGIYYSLRKKKKYGVFKAGRGTIVPIQYGYIETVLASDKNFYFMLKEGKNYGLADENGKIIVPVTYALVEASDENNALFILTDKKLKTFYLTKAGQIVEKKEE